MSEILGSLRKRGRPSKKIYEVATETAPKKVKSEPSMLENCDVEQVITPSSSTTETTPQTLSKNEEEILTGSSSTNHEELNLISVFKPEDEQKDKTEMETGSYCSNCGNELKDRGDGEREATVVKRPRGRPCKRKRKSYFGRPYPKKEAV